MGRVRLRFGGFDVEFVDRDHALSQFVEFAERGTYPVYVIYGPEGCGKTALLRQFAEVLKGFGYAVVRVNPLTEVFEDRLSVSGELRRFLREVPGDLGSGVRLLDAAVDLLYRAVKLGLRRRIALLADDVFQAVGLDRAETLVKGLLNMIEHPSISYERIVVVVASSEGVTRGRVGRHSWVSIMGLWNMSKDGFEKLYSLIPGSKPSLDSVWRATGGNPRLLESLYISNWDVDSVVGLISRRGVLDLVKRWGSVLWRVVDDPDYLWDKYPESEGLINDLIDLNLVARLWERDHGWIDVPPPRKDLELGIGEHYAWQTPLHREAVRRALERVNP